MQTSLSSRTQASRVDIQADPGGSLSILPSDPALLTQLLTVPGVFRVRGKKGAGQAWTWWTFLPDIVEAIKGAGGAVRLAGGQATLDTLLDRRRRALRASREELDLYPLEWWRRAFRLPYEPWEPFWKHQRVAAGFLLTAGRALLADDVGLGKSLSLVAAYLMLRELGEADSLLILSPDSAKWQWRSEIRKMVNPNYFDASRDVVVVDGTARERLLLYRTPAFIRIVNYEVVARDLPEIENLLRFGKTVLALDEGRRIRNRGTVISQTLRALVRKVPVPYRYVLNATPLENRLEEVWAILDFVDPTIYLSFNVFRRLHLVEGRFVSCWRCRRPYPLGMPECPRCKAPFRRGRKVFSKVCGEKGVDRLRARIAHRALRRTAAVLGWETPRLTSVVYKIDLDPGQRAVYDGIKAEKGGVLGRLVRCSMVCLSAEMSCADPIPAPSPKTRELLRLLSGEIQHEKVLVFTQSRQYVDHLVAHIRKAGLGPVAWIHGGVNSHDREHLRQSFNEGRTRVLVMDAAGEEALSLQAAPVVVNMDLPWNPTALIQRIGRVRPYLGGSERWIRVITILARNTVEERVVEKITDKIGLFSKVWGDPGIELEGVFDHGSLETLL